MRALMGLGLHSCTSHFIQVQAPLPGPPCQEPASSPSAVIDPDAGTTTSAMPFTSMRLSDSEASGSIFQAPAAQTLRRGSSESMCACCAALV